MMKMFGFDKRLASVKPGKPIPLPVLPAKPEARQQAAPRPRSSDSDGRLRRIRQTVEDNRLL